MAFNREAEEIEETLHHLFDETERLRKEIVSAKSKEKVLRELLAESVDALLADRLYRALEALSYMGLILGTSELNHQDGIDQFMIRASDFILEGKDVN